LNVHTFAMLGAMVGIAIIAVLAITTTHIPSWLSVLLFIAVVAQLLYSRQQTIKVGAAALDALRAKGPMTVSQLAQALERPNDRVLVIAALSRLRAKGAVTRAELDASAVSADAKDSHVYTAAA